jgi:hypothetical protein
LTNLKQTIPYARDVIKLSKEISPYLVISELGKGKGMCHLACVTLHSEEEKKNFWDNHEHFEIQNDLSPQLVLSNLEDAYNLHGWSRIAPLYNREHARVPYMYLSPKRKDTTKFRPLASYFRHKLKRVYRVAGQGLMIILKTLEVPHMNLFTTYSTKAKIREIYDHIEKFASEHKCSPHIETYSGDVQQLFTKLDFDTVKKSLEWAISTVKQTKVARGKYFVTINKLNKHMSRIGPRYSGQSLCQLSFQDILDICLFDMQNAFFEKNGAILRQIHGLAQGSPCSPPDAVCVLIYVEFHFYQSIRDDTRFSRCIFTGMRYVDDVRNVAICIPIPIEIARSKELLRMFIASLPPCLLLEPEENEDNTFRFLEGYQFFNNPDLKAAFVAKNYVMYEHHDTYKLLAGYPFQTYMGSYMDNPRKEMENNIFTRCFAISAYSVTPKALRLAVTSSMPDFKFSGFPLRSVRNVMKRFTTHVESQLQKTWVDIIHTHCTHDYYDNIHETPS